MSTKNNNNSAEAQNISDVLNMLKKSYNDDIEKSDTEKDIFAEISNDDNLSTVELQEKLKMEYFESPEKEADFDFEDDIYKIDENFIEEAEYVYEPTEEIKEAENELTEELEETVDDEPPFDILQAEDSSDESKDESINESSDDYAEFSEDYSDNNINNEDIQAPYLVDSVAPSESDTSNINEFQEKEELVFEEHFDLEDKEQNGEEYYFDDDNFEVEDNEYEEPQMIPLENFVDEDNIEIEFSSEDEDDTFEEAYDKVEKKESLYEIFVNKKLAEEAMEKSLNKQAQQTAVSEEQAHFSDDYHEKEKEDDFLEEFFDSSAVYKEAFSEVDRSELSLLMQFGDEEKVIYNSKSKVQDATDNFPINSEANNGDTYKKQENAEKEYEKIKSFYKKLVAAKKKLLLPLILASIFAFILLIYEGLPILGVEFVGIFNKNAMFVSYILFGLQFMIFGVLAVSKKMWDGVKRFFELKPNTYSLLAVAAVIMVMYDISASIAYVAIKERESDPMGYHVLFMLLVICVLVREFQQLKAQIKVLEFYFAEHLLHGKSEEENRVKYTLCKSKGKNSIAEKMAAGGFNPKKNIYFPYELNSVTEYFEAVKKIEKTSGVSLVGVIVSLAFSVVLGIVSIASRNDFFVFSNTIIISLYATLPIISILFAHMSFERLCNNSEIEGYAFANEDSIEAYASADMLVFKDLHLLKKVSPANIKLAIYDATAKEVLLGCLNAVYNEIGGPMCDVFSSAKNAKLGKCKISRIAKSGIEAVVGNNYSVLIGDEKFMERYRISFPKATYANPVDEQFTLCVSINGRVTARFAVRYQVNEMFEVFINRLSEDNIYCVIETFDPLVNTSMLAVVMPNKINKISIVHLNVNDLKGKSNTEQERFVMGIGENNNLLLARESRLNLAVAASTAKKMKRLKIWEKIYSISFMALGALITLAVTLSVGMHGFMALVIVLYWLIGSVGFAIMVSKLLPRKSRFFFTQR